MELKWVLRPFWWLYVAVTGIIVLVLGLVGIGAGLYVGGWVMLLGGFADTINLFKSPDPVTAADLGIVLAKIILAIPVGLFIAGIFLYPASAIVATWDKLGDAMDELEQRHKAGL